MAERRKKIRVRGSTKEMMARYLGRLFQGQSQTGISPSLVARQRLIAGTSSRGAELETVFRDFMAMGRDDWLHFLNVRPDWVIRFISFLNRCI